eukprot:544897-Rhodomonas_salina.1
MSPAAPPPRTPVCSPLIPIVSVPAQQAFQAATLQLAAGQRRPPEGQCYVLSRAATFTGKQLLSTGKRALVASKDPRRRKRDTKIAQRLAGAAIGEGGDEGTRGEGSEGREFRQQPRRQSQCEGRRGS